ncbi:DinB family protein [Krasilnikoviella flava]|uniref:AAA domain-containing protein n=1 Tax=Krasilnikoviella flava TaxID=526729 RepID=A0A1T5L6J6_9MICO|nr:DinB family protein [Krasilnikoviella flava]SKC71667.1 AAA domain-containing protein [Krasilnikoviella flava]
MTVTLLTGPPGAGKTTVAVLLAADAERPTVTLTTDTFYRSISTGFVPPYLAGSQRQNEVVADAIVAATTAYARGGYDVVLDGVVGPWFLPRFRAAAAREDWDLAYVVLRPGLDATLARATGRADAELRDPAAVRSMHAAFADLGELEPHARDTTDEEPAATATAVRAALDDGAFRLPTPAPEAEEDRRVDPPLRADELTTLRAFLDFHRDTLRWKTAGLTAEQLNAVHPPSSLTLGGLLKHLALVETDWFAVKLDGDTAMAPFDTADWDADRDWEFHSAADDSPEELRALLDAAVADSDRRVDAAVAAGEGLDRLSRTESNRPGEGAFSLRWILVHMIEEYARHNGQVDLIREAIDGATGE